MATPFVWGSAGSKLTPQEVERQRAIADLMMQSGADFSPVAHWSQGATRVAQSLVGGLANRRADRIEREGREGATAAITKLLGGYSGSSAKSAAPARTASEPVAGPAPNDRVQTAFNTVEASQRSPDQRVQTAFNIVEGGSNADAIRAGLIERGLPAHVADGFMMNFRDESGLNPGINEKSPVVPGSRGGYGLAQWTGPRRVALEAYAAERGVPVSDTNLQLDFLKSELDGAEANAAKSIMATSNPGEAAAAIARDFLRPAPEHLERRVAAYTGAADSDMAALPTAQPAQNFSVPGSLPGQPNIAALMQAASNPWLSKAQQTVIGALLEQELKNNGPQKPIEVNGRLVDPRTFEVVADFSEAKAPDVESFYDEATGMEYKAKWNPQTQSYERVGGVKAPSGTQLSVDPNTGAVTFQQGSGLKPLTEAQSKDTVFVTRASGALPIIDQHGEALARLGEATGGGLPVVGNYMKSPEYQQAEQAGKEFLQAILRKDTGAAITKEEQDEYGSVYLPRPGDSQAVLDQKKASRARALQAIELGLPPAALLKLEGAGVKLSKDRAQAEKPISEMTDEELEAIANGN